MKFLSLFLSTLFVLLATVVPASAADVSNISVQQLKTMQQQTDTLLYLLDVRTTGEHNAGAIPNTDGNADWFNWKSAFASLEKKPNKNETLIVYCKSGGRSSRAASWLSDQGYTKVYNVTGGYTAWQNQ